ncbi:hypothetical protein MMC08_007298 [Hypocenomyce scalaris]|nr:hypothetical protein [Hypocenomyce scalaris]
MPDGGVIRSEHCRSAQSANTIKSYHYGPDAHWVSADIGLRSNASLPRAQISCENNEPTSVVGQAYSGNTPRHSPPRLQHKQPVNGLRARSMPRADPVPTASPRTPSPNGKAHYSMASDYSNVSPKNSPKKKRKDNGFRMTLRRFFGRKSTGGQSHVAGSAQSHRSDPINYKPSATEHPIQRSVSLPIHEVTQQSAVGSHSPFVPTIPPREGDTHEVLSFPQSPERRRASLPGGILTTQMEEVVTTEPDEYYFPSDSQHLSGSGDIGFAVTSGSNDKRRSRSADALRDLNNEHRMSPIQWRRWRRRSDEIRYWRESTGEIPAIFASIDPQLAQDVEQADLHAKQSVVLEQDRETKEEPENFDFGLLADAMHSQERIAIDERVITLEVKMMDLEYAISKLQAHTPGWPNLLSEQPKSVSDVSIYSQAPAHQEDRDSPDPERFALTPPTKQSHSNYRPQTTPHSTVEPSVHTILRPPSISATLRPSTTLHPQLVSPKEPKESTSTRSSMTPLTLEHYMALISLIRRERSARMRLEDQVTKLQEQVSDLNRAPSRPWMLGPMGSMDSIAHQQQTRQRRGRASQESQETDTDDDGVQDVYETPVERGEVEFQALRAEEEGVAF